MKLPNGFSPLVRAGSARRDILVPYQAGPLASPRAAKLERRLLTASAPTIERRQWTTSKHLLVVRPRRPRAACVGARGLEDGPSLPRLKPETRGGFDQRRADEARRAREEILAFLEDLDSQHQRPIAHAGLEQERCLPDGAERGRRSAEKDRVWAGHAEL